MAGAHYAMESLCFPGTQASPFPPSTEAQDWNNWEPVPLFLDWGVYPHTKELREEGQCILSTQPVQSCSLQ